MTRNLLFVMVTAALATGFACGAPEAPSAPSPAPVAQTAPPPPSGEDAGSPSTTPPPEDGGTPPASGWQVAWEEGFEGNGLPEGAWSPDPVPDDGPFADDGAFFRAQGVVPPDAYRASVPFGTDGWLTAESYTRNPKTPFDALLSVVPDPSGAPGHVLRLASPEHTDATVIRSTAPLPDRYRISLRVGFAQFGDGKPGLNGYSSGDETAGPWHPGAKATAQNGFYWLTILDAQPRPHNNTWIHHHRKVVIDSDNNTPPWMEMWNGSAFELNGEQPVMMIALDGAAPVSDLYGSPFYSYSAGAWQPSGAVRAVDGYLPNQWYQASIERADGEMTLSISGRFRSGERTYSATIDLAQRCVWHFNRTPAEESEACEGPAWPRGASFPDWFMFGDPHNNYYEGSVYYDDIKLETWTG
jgi:hypothetical protein